MKKSEYINNNPLEVSELVLNPDNSVYHLHLRPENLAHKIIVVGDPFRVPKISAHFSKIFHKIVSREFVTHTGIFNNTEISVVSTGIGCDNIDIVLTELDEVVNVDLEKRQIKENKTSLEIVRLGTSGALQEYVPVDSFMFSKYALGFDGLLNFYDHSLEDDEVDLLQEFIAHTDWNTSLNPPYCVSADNNLLNKLSSGHNTGITATANGFYAPQGRIIRLQPAISNINEKMRSFIWCDNRITNYEMESSALYGLSALLGHQACTVCAIIANRYRKEYSKNYQLAIDELIRLVLERLTM